MEETQNTTENTRKRTRKSTAIQAINELGKLPPQAVELEEAVLGAMMLERDALSAVIDILKPDCFYKEAHQKIFSAILSLFNKAEPIDILTVTNELKKEGNLDIAGGPYYITQLTNRVVSGANAEYHARIILQKFIQRELIQISSDIIRDSYEETSDVFDILDKAEQNLFSISEGSLRRNYDDMHTLVREAIKEIEAAKDHEGYLRGIPSGFTELDRVTNGWQKSDLVVIASRPGMGKTAFMLSLARNAAVSFQKPIAVFSLEMSSVQLITRLISSESEIPAEKLKKGNIAPHEWEQLNTKIKGLVDAPLYIDDTPALNIFELRAKCRRLKSQHNIQLVVIDYLQLMTSGSDGRGNREQEISAISRSLKALAKELDIPIIALSQLSREVEKRPGSKKPILSDLRESGAIEQDADMVLFIYRPEYYKIDVDEDGNPTTGMADIIISKHRNGALKDVKLRFIANFAKFSELDTSYDEMPLEANVGFEDEPKSYTVPSKLNEMTEEDEDDIPF